ncbi:hypothetical protein ACTFIY_002188 [Dictyostelium cf. discoideum]
MEKIQRISDLVAAYQKVSSFKKIEKKLNNGKSYKIKKIFLMRGRYFYPAKVNRKSASNITLIKNTAMNTFQNIEEATDEEIYNRMYAAKQREKMLKTSAFVQSFLGMAGQSYQKALQKHGLTSSDGTFEYNEEDDEDYEPSESDDDEGQQNGEEEEEEDNSDTEDEEEQQLKQLEAKNEEDDEEFEEQEIDEDEDEVDEDEENGEDEGFEMEDDFEDSE